ISIGSSCLVGVSGAASPGGGAWANVVPAVNARATENKVICRQWQCMTRPRTSEHRAGSYGGGVRCRQYPISGRQAVLDGREVTLGVDEPSAATSIEGDS